LRPSSPALTDADLSQLREALIERVGPVPGRGVIVDVTALDVMDSFAVVRSGTSPTWRGCAGGDRDRWDSPEVAFAMVQLGLTLKACPPRWISRKALLFTTTRPQLRIERGSGRIDRG